MAKHFIMHNLSEINPIVDDAIYIANDVYHLDEETDQNMWAISLSEVVTRELTVEKLECFVQLLLDQRLCQLQQEGERRSAIFYLWFDEQALQLRFNFISSNYVSLPIRCEIKRSDVLAPILAHFLVTVCSAGEQNFEDICALDDSGDDENDESFMLEVFTTMLCPINGSATIS